MKPNKTVPNHPSARVAGTSRSVFSAIVAALLMAALTAAARSQHFSPKHSRALPWLKPGDIVYADSGDALDGGFIIKVDGATGDSMVLCSGGYLQTPFDLVVDRRGQIIVSDSGRLIEIDPRDGAQTLLADNSRGPLGWPFGLALTPTGDVLAANLTSVVRFDAETSQVRVAASGGHLAQPLAVATSNNGFFFVLDLGPINQIIRVNRQTHAQRVITKGGLLNHPQAIAVQGEHIYVTDIADLDNSFGTGRIICVNAKTGSQTVVSEGGNLVRPVGIAVDEEDQIIVGDPYTINPNSLHIRDGGFDGGIIRIDPDTGGQTLLARGQGGFLNPRGVAIVPNSAIAQANK
jgi:sugar lactone lactonase YvrE